MTLSLSSQLRERQLHVTSTNTAALAAGRKGKKPRVSVLHDAKTAAALDNETVWATAQNGLAALLPSVPALAQFADALFGRTSVLFDRALLNKSDAAAHDARVDACLQLLSPHLQSRAALKLLEHLLHAHAVHVHNVDALLRAALPYHEAPIFARIVSFARLELTKWHFALELQRQLASERRDGAALQPLSRLSLAKRCAIDDALLQFICESACVDDAPSLWVTLYAVTVLDLLSETTRVDDALMHRLLPHALRSVRSADRADHRHAGCMILAQLCARASLRHSQALQSVLDSVSRAMLHRDSMRTALLALAHVCRTQTPPHLSTETVDRLLYEVPQCESSLVSLHRESLDVAALASLLLDATASRCTSGDVRSLAFAATLLAHSNTAAPVDNSADLVGAAPAAALLSRASVLRFVETFIQSLTQLQPSTSGGTTEQDELTRVAWRDAIAVLRALDTRHAFVLDHTIAKLLAHDSPSGDALLHVVCSMLPGVRHTPMPDARCTLGAALAHPLGALRARALTRGGELLAGVTADALLDISADDTSNLLFVRNAILHALHDDDEDVVRAALNAVAQYGDAFARNRALLSFVQQILLVDVDARRLQTAALHALAAATPDASDAAHEWLVATAPLVFGQLFETATTRTVSQTARDVCASGKFAHPLFAGLKSATSVAASHDAATAAAVNANVELIDTLARNVAADPDTLVPLCCAALDASSVRGRWLAVLTLDAALAHSKSPSALLKVLVPLALTHLHAEWAALDVAERAQFSEFSDRLDIARLYATADLNRASPAWVAVLLAVLRRCVVQLLRLGGEGATTAYHSTDYGQMDEDDDDDASDAFALRFALRAVLRDALSDRSMALALRPHLQAILTAAGHAGVLPLLSSFWCTRPEQASVTALHIAAALIATRGLPDNGWSTLLVALLPPLTSKSEPLRVGALACLSAAARHGERAGKFIQGSVRILLDMQHEVQLDGRVARESLATLANLLPADALEAGHIALARAALAMPPFVAMPTMRAVQSYVSPAKAALVMPTLLALVSPDSPLRLSTTRCKLIGVLVRTIAADTAATFAAGGSGEQFVRHALLAPLRGTRRAMERMRAHVADQMTPSLFRTLPESVVATLFAVLCRARREHAAVDVTARALTTALRLMPLPFAVLKGALRVSQSSPRPAALAAPRKRARKSGDIVAAAPADEPADTVEPAVHVLERMVDVLEVLHVRVTTGASGSTDVRLVGALCGTLHGLLSLANDVARSYAQQLALTILLELVNRIEAAASDEKQLDELRSQLSIDALVDTLRSSGDNSQTQRHVLLLLAELARLFPALVLAQVMAVFQFVGATAMRRDDAHSFQTIERTIRALVPAVVVHARNPDADIAQLLDLFVDAAVHVPAHRRLLLFTVLASTLAASYLPSLVERLLVYAARMRDASNEPAAESDTQDGQTKMFDAASLAGDLLRAYPPARVISVLRSLVTSLAKCQEVLSSDDPAADVAGPLCHMAWRTLAPSARATFAMALPDLLQSTLASSELLGGLLVARSAAETAALQLALSDLFVGLLRYDIDSSTAQAKARRAQRHWWAARRQTNSKLLVQVSAMLDVATLVSSIETLLADGDARVRRRAATVLAETVAQTKLRDGEGNKSEVAMVVALVPTLLRRLNAADAGEQDLNRQHMLVALDAIAASCGMLRPQQFLDLVPLVLGSLADSSEPVAAAAFVLFATLIERLGARLTPTLPELLPSLLRDAAAALQAGRRTDGDADDDDDEAPVVTLLRLSTLTALHAAAVTLGSLLHGSLPQLLSLLVSSAARRDARSAAKADATLTALAERVEMRLLVGPLYTTYKQVVQTDDHTPLLALFRFGQHMVERASHADALQQRTLLFKCCLACFDYRAKHAQSPSMADDVESLLSELFLALVLKLSETHFKPIFLKLLDWASSTNSLPRLILFYSLLRRITSSLRSIAVPYFEYALPDVVKRLRPSSDATSGKAEQSASDGDDDDEDDNDDEDDGAAADINDARGSKRRRFSRDEGSRLTIVVLDALQLCFTHDRDQFIDQKRFDALLPAIAQQLEPREPFSSDKYSAFIQDHVQPCLVALAVSLNSETHWQAIHNAVLAFAHHRSWRVRLASLKIVDAMYDTIGEQMLPLLPETLPYLSELMEDSNSDVERFAHAAVERLERVLGNESLRELL